MARGKKGTVEYGVNINGSAVSYTSSPPKINIAIVGNLHSGSYRSHALHWNAVHINHHHFGAPKTWYGVPGHSAPEFEKVVQHCVYADDTLSTSREDGAFGEFVITFLAHIMRDLVMLVGIMHFLALSRMPIVPYEELLRKEAMLLSNSSNQEDNSVVDSVSSLHVKPLQTGMLCGAHCVELL
ncbi:transcription factor jumonji (jmj) family protein [Actinidia rufa]|uniref:Transcription factor jumonji (Jmj) family protein n=1 Tax=Actinidia rufa TaxID=165716 RepID=A0A7J0EDK2_9ERIC|nr:transcription factor jumonji (jmj) family protein [Actinidia rufa]